MAVKKNRPKKAPNAYATFSLKRNGRNGLPLMFGNIRALAKHPRRWCVTFDVEHFGETVLHGDPAVVIDSQAFTTSGPTTLLDFLAQVINPHVDWLLEEYKGRIIDICFRIDPVRP